MLLCLLLRKSARRSGKYSTPGSRHIPVLSLTSLSICYLGEGNTAAAAEAWLRARGLAQSNRCSPGGLWRLKRQSERRGYKQGSPESRSESPHLVYQNNHIPQWSLRHCHKNLWFATPWVKLAISQHSGANCRTTNVPYTTTPNSNRQLPKLLLW